MASLYVVGIDFGNDASFIAVPKSGGIETISNDYSLRQTPSCVAFSNRTRVLGVAAKNQIITNMKNTVMGFKRFLGKPFDDPAVQHELRFNPFVPCKLRDGTVGVKVHYLDEEHTFSMQQVTAMYFTKLKETAEAALQCEVNQCVIGVPSFFDNVERQALLDAAAIAGWKVLRIFNETVATALTYGIYKQDLPAPEETPRNVVFVDWGHTSLQVAVCAFNKGKLKVLASSSDPLLGGRDVDFAIAEHFSQEFQQKYGINPMKNGKAFIRLMAEVEKLKKQMSANSTKLPMNIECLMDEKDVHAEMNRAEMEELCARLFERAEAVMRDCLMNSKLKAEEIAAVEIVGGASRTPAMKGLIEKVFEKGASTTLNQDEAVARGCALQCAMLCPAILVRDFSITDIQPYAIKILFEPASNEDGQLEVFPKYHAIPFTKVLTFYRKAPFQLKAVYADSDKFIGQFYIKDVKPDAKGQNQKVKVKAHINMDGIFTITQAFLTEKPVAPPPTPPPEEAMDSSPAPEQPKEGEKGGEEVKTGEKKKKESGKMTELQVEVLLYGAYEIGQLNNLTENEGKMVATDKQERDRVDARNALEEYVYDLRGKLGEEGELGNYVERQSRMDLQGMLESVESWLYEDGEDCVKTIYAEKLKDLMAAGEPIKRRKFEFETQPAMFQEFSSMLQLTHKAIQQYNKGEKYGHLPKDEMNQVEEKTMKASKWVDETRSKLNAMAPHNNLPISVEDIKMEMSNFQQDVQKILSKPQPPPPQQTEPVVQEPMDSSPVPEAEINGDCSKSQ